jgi:hypothetical protein
MSDDPLFKNVTDPVERRKKLVENSQIVTHDLRKIALERCGDAGTDVFNLAQYLGAVIRELDALADAG